MADLYEILGVPREANHAAVQRAFRSLARKCHPDAGGDQASFQRVKLAYSVLSDPTKREKYDATGEIDEDKPDNSFAEVVQTIGLALATVVANLAGKGRKADSEDLVAIVTASLKKRVDELHQQRGGLETIRVFITDSVDRFETKDGENVIAEIQRASLKQVQKNLESLDHSLEIHKRAIGVVKKYKYNHREMRRAGRTFTSAATTGIWTT